MHRFSVAVLACVVVISIGGCSASPAATAPTELPILVLDPEEPDPEALAALFLGDGLSRQEGATPDDTRAIFARGDEAVWIGPGELTYLAGEPREPVTVTLDEARGVALAFLNDTIGLPDDVVQVERVGAVMAEELDSSGPGTPYSYSIEWQRVIDGVPVAGAQWIRVEVCESGVVSQLHRRWHRVVSEGEVIRLQPPDEIIDIAAGLKGGSCPDHSAEPTVEDVAAARLVYHVPFTGDQHLMIPAWEVTASDGEQYYFHAGTGAALDW